MPNFCVPQHLVEKLKSSALAGKVDIARLYEMSSQERRDFFTKYTDKELGKFLNTEFEKAMVAKQKNAMTSWAKSVFLPKEQTKPTFKSILDKINELDNLGVLTPANEKQFLQDLVSDKLGINVSPEEVRVISKRAAKIDKAQEALGTNLGSPEHLKENIDFFKAKKEMDDYLLSLNPASKLKVATGTIGRGMMLASVKSPILNIGSNLEVGATEAIVRRLSGNGLRGTNNKLARDYIKMVNTIYQKTGYDISRMMDLSDTGASGGRVLGDTVHAQGKGAVRKVGQVVEDVVFKQLMGAPDAAFASAHFADSVNTAALGLAKGDRKLANEYMLDAMRINPQTAEGEILRAQGVMDAQVATWTNQSWANRVSDGIRKILNDVTGDARLGDFLLPFVKTPANVIATGMDYAGLGVPKAAIVALKNLHNIKDPEVLRKISRDLVRSGVGFTGAVIIASQLSNDDFVGAFDPARQQIEQLRGTNYNAIKIGNKWVSTDWLGPLGVPTSAIMYARKYGKTAPDKAVMYARGVGSQALQIPGVKDAALFFSNQSKKSKQTAAEAATSASNYISGQLYSRLVPGGLSDLAKAFDGYQRETPKGWSAVQAQIPGARNHLPAKTNIFGEPVKDENAFINILFGSRVTTDRSTPLINEISRVQESTGKTINFTDWKKSNSNDLAQFKQAVGKDTYDKAAKEYGQTLKTALEQVTQDDRYKSASDSEKATILNSVDSKAQAKIFKQYDFKPAKTQSNGNKKSLLQSIQ